MDTDTQAIKDWLKQHQISEVEVLVPDMTGNARGKFIPAQQFLDLGDPKLPESIMVQTVTGEYSDDHWEFVEPTDTDMILKPDASTLRVVPWAREPTAQIIHDCYTMEGELHPLSTRNVLRKVLKLFDDEGLEPVVAPEMEFYLVAKNTDPDNVLTPPHGRSGRTESARLSYSIDAVAEFEIESFLPFGEGVVFRDPHAALVIPGHRDGVLHFGFGSGNYTFSYLSNGNLVCKFDGTAHLHGEKLSYILCARHQLRVQKLALRRIVK